MNEFSIGQYRISEQVLKTRLESLSKAQHGRHWIKTDLSVGEFSPFTKVMWNISKFLPFLRSFFDAAKPQDITLTLTQLKSQIVHNKELSTIFNSAAVAYESLTHQKVTRIDTVAEVPPLTQPPHILTPSSPAKPVKPAVQNISLCDPKSYNPEKTKTVSGLFDMEALMKEQYKGHIGMQQQGQTLAKNYYFQNCHGGGDCFYLGYISGWLHHLIQAKPHNFNIFQEAMRRLQDHPNESTAQVITILKDLEEKPTSENLYRYLFDETKMNAFVQCLRYVAAEGVKTMDDGRGGLQFDDDQIAAVIFENPDFKDVEKSPNKQKAFSDHQSRMGENVQTPEIAVLNRWIAPVSICFSQDHREETLRGKFAEGYNEGHPITLFQRNNHFDALIPKK